MGLHMRGKWPLQTHEGSEQHLSLGLTPSQTSPWGCAELAAATFALPGISAGVLLSNAGQDSTGRGLSILISGNVGGHTGVLSIPYRSCLGAQHPWCRMY